MKRLAKIALFSVLFALLIAPLQPSFADDDEASPLDKASEKSAGND
jgi:hypothetical protein